MNQWPTRRLVGVTLTVGTVLYLIYYVPGAIAYVFGRVWNITVVLIIATALAVLVSPLVRLLCRARVRLPERGKRMIATLLVLALVLWLGWLVASATASQLAHEVQGLLIMSRLWLTQAPTQVRDWLAAHSEDFPPVVVTQATEAVAQATQNLLKFQFGFAKGALLGGWVAVETFVVPLLAFYFLTDGRALRDGFLSLLPRRFLPFVTAVLDDVVVLLNSYVRALVLICLIDALVVGLGLYACGVSMYLILAVIVGALRLAPIVGPIVAGVPVVGVTMLQNGPHTGMVVLVCYLVLFLLDGKFLTPILLAGGTTLHPVTVIVSLLIGYEFVGLVGLLIAVPTAGIIRVVYLRYREMFGDQNGNGGQPEPEAATQTGPQ
jgi:predicted PurR-regulated permease PerM